MILIQDMDMIRNDLERGKDVRIPYRVVVNNSTFSVFDGLEYSNVIHSFPLNEIDLEDA